MDGWKVVGERNIQIYHFDRSRRFFNDVGLYLKDKVGLPMTCMLVVDEWMDGWREGGREGHR